jgi:hypothetical protein
MSMSDSRGPQEYKQNSPLLSSNVMKTVHRILKQPFLLGRIVDLDQWCGLGRSRSHLCRVKGTTQRRSRRVSVHLRSQHVVDHVGHCLELGSNGSRHVPAKVWEQHFGDCFGNGRHDQVVVYIFRWFASIVQFYEHMLHAIERSGCVWGKGLRAIPARTVFGIIRATSTKRMRKKFTSFLQNSHERDEDKICMFAPFLKSALVI